MRSLCLVSFLGLLPFLAQEPTGAGRVGKPGLLPKSFQRGVCWVGMDREAELRRISKMGVRWISLTPFAYGHSVPGRVPDGGYRPSRHRGEKLEDIRRVTRKAHELGLAVQIKPHVWARGRDGFWRGQIAFEKEEDWDAWFHAYGSFLKPFVTMAAEEKAEAFCIGTELVGTTGQTARWKGMIRRIREIYSGALTYGAHWDGEFERIRFWKELDYIGVQGYFPLVSFADRNPSPGELRKGWKTWMDRLEAVAKRTGRKVLFTELGYKPVQGTAHRPWEWRSRTPFDSAAQAEAWKAFFEAARRRRFVEGVFVWKWFAGFQGRRRSSWKEFTPQGLPAEEIIRRYFRG